MRPDNTTLCPNSIDRLAVLSVTPGASWAWAGNTQALAARAVAMTNAQERDLFFTPRIFPPIDA
jgi:hypothetical protein